MAECVSPLDTGHRQPVHAAQLDHHGRRLATASADRSVRVWEVVTRKFITELQGHKAPVWAVAWSHPMFGSLLASAGEDKCVLLWREAGSKWCQVHRQELQGPVMSIAFGPWEYGLQLAIACCDGLVTVLSYGSATVGDDHWYVESFKAHEGGVFALCWAPAVCPAVLGGTEPAARTPTLESRKIVTGGADNQVRIWRHDGQTNDWVDNHHFESGEHTDWVRDVAWRPNVGIPSNTVASCAEDGTVVIWTQAMVGQPWRRVSKWDLAASAWQLSWSTTGSILAVSTSDNRVLLYKEAASGRWEAVEAFDPQESERKSSPSQELIGFASDMTEAPAQEGSGAAATKASAEAFGALGPVRKSGPSSGEVVDFTLELPDSPPQVSAGVAVAKAPAKPGRGGQRRLLQPTRKPSLESVGSFGSEA